MMDIGPEDIAVKEPQPNFGSWSAVASQAARAAIPVARFGHTFGELADKVYMSPDHCVVYLARRVGEARQARDRSTWIGGRIYNWMTGAQFETVDMSGAVFASALKTLGEEVPADFPYGSDLTLRFEIAAKLEQEIRAKAKAEGRIT